MIVTLLYLFGVLLLIASALVFFGVIAFGTASAAGLLIVGIIFCVVAYVLSRGNAHV